ncbi:MAG: hypothetical protein WA208_18465 [Thermoanaerobaculia bacterium]
MRCWAAALGDCDAVQSREHYLSRSIIGTGEVVVSGLRSLGGRAATISAERLVAKVLCKRHNELLSPLDAAAGDFFRVLKAFKYRAGMRARGARKRGGVDVYRVDGALVERWMLKTVINLAFARRTPSGERWCVPAGWVTSVFGRTAFPDGCGLYLLQGTSNLNDSPTSVLRVAVLTADGGVGEKRDGMVIGGQFAIEDVQFAVLMQPVGSVNGAYRLRHIRDARAFRLRQVLNVDWAGLR